MKKRRKGRSPHDNVSQNSSRTKPLKKRSRDRSSFDRRGAIADESKNEERTISAKATHAGANKTKGTQALRGRVIKNPRGFAFVVLDPPLPGTREDIFLDANEASSLVTNDLVDVALDFDRRSGRRVGKLLQVVERGLEAAVGEFKMGPYGPTVEILGKGMEINAPVRPGGKQQNIIPGSAVLVKLHYDTVYNEAPTAEIISILGQSLDHSTDDALILTKYKLKADFPEDVIRASEVIPQTISAKDLEGREDLRELPFVTIDGPTAKDFDDAVYARTLPNGNLNLFVAVADVAHYVKHNNAIDDEALRRGNSTYLPTLVVPMLPERLSNGLCSLNPREDRLVMVAEMEFQQNGKKVRQSFSEAVIHSHRRCTYEEVQRFFDHPNALDFTREVADSLNNLRAVFRMLNKNRLDRGAIDLDLTETQVVVGPGGEVKGLKKAERWESHRLIEECMLAANEAVAEYLSEAGVPIPYRVHEPPELEAVQKFCEVARTLGLNIQVRGENWNFMYQHFLEAMRGSPAQAVLNFLLLRSMKQAYYSSANLGHFALASSAYAHFTSPIRRYPDLILHRQLKSLLLAQQKEKQAHPAYSEGKIEEMSQHCSRRERHSMDAEREMIRIKQVRFAERYVGEEFTGKVISMNSKGLFIELQDLSIEGFLEIERLGYGFAFNERQMFFRASRSGRRIMLGDEIPVVISRTNPHLLRIDLDPAENAVSSRDREHESSRTVPGRGTVRSSERAKENLPRAHPPRTSAYPEGNASEYKSKQFKRQPVDFHSTRAGNRSFPKGPEGFLARIELLKRSKQKDLRSGPNEQERVDTSSIPAKEKKRSKRNSSGRRDSRGGRRSRR